MRQIGIVLFTSFLNVSVLLGCEKQEPNIDLASIGVSDVDKIEHTGTTGGEDNRYSYSFSDSEISGFIDLLNQVELSNAVDESKALSNGAVSYYTLCFTDSEKLTISPGQYFKIEDMYYEFKNYDELWDSFIRFNSIY